ncbi:Delta(7)-sterol 5(6)-desaturase [Saliniradius amylolyticus]|uniref:Delta(7)-sterol 5(6)-desaturase n=1 Tax=Saliniradius amylolyticus TaxID=2183582 RepID=A0A2S2E5T4_9ALTE|nr:sterol desaturase family protein [Saliniradius amylolyticus]AWL13011.1 Delta(7)-sterol 5(6)-desaturase [Saliniradius amylolyticus]
MQDGSLIRLSVFVSILALMTLWQTLAPARSTSVAPRQRWLSNFGLMVMGALLARLAVPAGLAGLAFNLQQQHWGLFNLTQWPLWLEVIVGLLILDCAIYWQHRLFHVVPFLWRFHRVHHADPHVDVSTGVRFHPLEILLSLLIKMAVVALFGIAPLTILMFEVILNATSLFNHTNVRLPGWLERPLRWLIVTQAMHRIHHSQRPVETNSNYGFNLSVWDRLFGSYTHRARLGDSGVQLGLRQYPKTENNTSLKALLLMPFRR